MRPLLKPYLPRSLFGRAALILIVPIVTIQLVVSIVFIQRHFEGVTRQMTGGVTIELEYLLAEVRRAPSLAEARTRATRLAGALDMTVALPAQPQTTVTDRRRFWDWSGREVIASLHERVSSLRTVDLRSDPRRVRMLIDTRHGPMAVALDRRRVSASNPHQLLVLMMVASVFLTLISYVFLRNQLSPIARLAAAAEAFGRGHSVPYRPRGPTRCGLRDTRFWTCAPGSSGRSNSARCCCPGSATTCARH